MEFLKKLKKLFFEKEEQQVDENISLEEIKNKVSEKNKVINLKLQKQVEDFYIEIYEIIDQLKEDFEILKQAKIKKVSAPEKIKRIVLIGRDEFIENCKVFVENIKEKKEIYEVVEYFEKKYLEFRTKSAKNYLKTTELIGDETEKVMKNILQIVKLVKKLYKQNKKEFETLKIIKEIDLKFTELEKNKKEYSNINKAIKEKKKNKDNELKIENEIKEKIEKIKSSEEFKYKENLEKEIEQIKIKLYNLESKTKLIVDSKLIEKNQYHEFEKEKINFMSEFLKDSVESLIKYDTQLLYDVIKDIIKRLESDVIEVKNKLKLLEKLNIKKENLDNLKKDIIETKNNLIQIKTRYANIDTGQESLDRELFKIKDEESKVEKELHALSLKNESIKNKIKELENQIKDNYFKIINL